MPELTDEMIRDAMERAEKVACSPLGDRCWLHPYGATDAPCDRKGRCKVGWISRDAGRQAWDVMLDLNTGEARLLRLPDLR